MYERRRQRLLLRVALSLAASLLLLTAWYLYVVRGGHDTLELWVGGRRLEILHPRWFGLVALLPWIWIVQGISLVDLPRGQQWLAMGARVALVLAIVGAMTAVSWTRSIRRVCTVVLVDVSDSVPDEALARASEYVDALRATAGPDDRLRIVTFDREVRVPALPEDLLAPLPSGWLQRHGAAGTGTDIQSALRMAYGLFPPGFSKRIVVVSDGAETTGASLAEVEIASSFGIRLSTRSFPAAYRHEVAVRAVRMPPAVRVRAPFEVRVEIHASDSEVPASLTVHKDGILDHSEELVLASGRNEVSYETEAFEPGLARFEVELALTAEDRSTHDTFPSNNRFVDIVIVHGRSQVLLVDGTPKYAAALRRALEAAGMGVEVRGPRGVPESLAELMRFDAVIISDVSAELVSHASMAALERYVKEAGGGLVVAGGEHSFGPGRYEGTRLARILPVTMAAERRPDTPSLAIVLLIDKSGSMDGKKMEMAIRAAQAVVELLGPSDKVGVLAFDARLVEVVRLQAASNRVRILDTIKGLSAGGGTDIYPALLKAYDDLRTTSAALKHVILLSDGRSSSEGIIPLVHSMASERITVTAVGIGDEIDVSLMTAVARDGGGRFYRTNNPLNLPRIFTKETETVVRSSLVERPVRARVVKPMALVKGVSFSSAPDLLGYVVTRARPGADEVLDIAETSEPLLVSWHLGAGRVVAWTSDVKPRWSVAWLKWSGFGKLWAQILRETMRRRSEERFEVVAEVSGDEVHVALDAIDEADRFVNGLEASVRMYAPSDPRRTVEVDMHQTAAGRYEAVLHPPALGAYLLEVRHRAPDGRAGVARTTVSLPYPREHLTLDGDRLRLALLAERTGGFADPEPAMLWEPGESTSLREPLWPYLALLALGFLVLDVVLRRVRLFARRPISAAARSGG